MGKSTTYMAIFNSKLLVYQRVKKKKMKFWDARFSYITQVIEKKSRRNWYMLVDSYGQIPMFAAQYHCFQWSQPSFLAWQIYVWMFKSIVCGQQPPVWMAKLIFVFALKWQWLIHPPFVQKQNNPWFVNSPFLLVNVFMCRMVPQHFAGQISDGNPRQSKQTGCSAVDLIRIDHIWLVVWNIFIFPYIGNNHPNWLIFFRGVETTNQTYV